jgi:hypothetical protein
MLTHAIFCRFLFYRVVRSLPPQATKELKVAEHGVFGQW